MEAEEGVGGVCQVLPAHQAPVLPGSAAAATATAEERIRDQPRTSRTSTQPHPGSHRCSGSSTSLSPVLL